MWPISHFHSLGREGRGSVDNPKLFFCFTFFLLWFTIPINLIVIGFRKRINVVACCVWNKSRRLGHCHLSRLLFVWNKLNRATRTMSRLLCVWDKINRATRTLSRLVCVWNKLNRATWTISRLLCVWNKLNRPRATN